MTRGRLVALVGVSVMCVGGCSEASSSTHRGTTIPEPDTDTRVIVLEDIASVPEAGVSVDFTLGAGETEQDEFGTVSGVAVDALGRIYVLDPMSFRVRVYGDDGSFVRDIGRSGSGPGELTRPHGATGRRPNSGITIAGDTLFVLDDRLHLFDTVNRPGFAGDSNP